MLGKNFVESLSYKKLFIINQLKSTDASLKQDDSTNRQSLFNHVYLSPHFDDAVLSCGGLIHRQRSENSSVTVITICAGRPDYHHISAFANELHKAWGGIADPVATRRAEDLEVLDGLGVKVHHLDIQDGIYRHSRGEFIYPNEKSLYKAVRLEELETIPKLLKQELSKRIPHKENSIIYGPLAAGNHIDHQLVRELAVELYYDKWKVKFYEDYPYAKNPEGIQRALRMFSFSLRSESFPIDVESKTLMIKGYKTQISSIFGNDSRIKKAMDEYSEAVAKESGLKGCHAERIWIPNP